MGLYRLGNDGQKVAAQKPSVSVENKSDIVNGSTNDKFNPSSPYEMATERRSVQTTTPTAFAQLHPATNRVSPFSFR